MIRSISLVAAVLMLLVASSCGPMRATSAISQAKDELYRAKLAGAHVLEDGARYETKAQLNYYLAVEFVEKSKEFRGFSEFDAAEFFGLKAAKLAADAVKYLDDAKKQIGKKCVQVQFVK
jgi:hypothetical protein